MKRNLPKHSHGTRQTNWYMDCKKCRLKLGIDAWLSVNKKGVFFKHGKQI